MRRLSIPEKHLLVWLLGSGEHRSFVTQLDNYTVEDMDDGRMGSVRLSSDRNPDDRTFGRCIAEAQCLDADGAHISIAINTDQYGDLYEIDVWKVNFEPLIEYPDPARCIREKFGERAYLIT